MISDVTFFLAADMTITSLIDNVSFRQLQTQHGLSLHIRLDDGRRILFDMGQDNLFITNADKLGINIAETDIAVISHGHYDHGGGLGFFLTKNKKSPVYIHQGAFLPHFSKHEDGWHDIGLNSHLQTCSQLISTSGITHIQSGITLFAEIEECYNPPAGNRRLYGPDKTACDNFCHEQNLLIREGDNLVLFAGCAHMGIANIILSANKIADKMPTHVFAGMHISQGSSEEIKSLASILKEYEDCRYYTMHCTGYQSFEELKKYLGNQIRYFSCGDSISI